MPNIRISRDGQEMGPYSVEEVKRYLADGLLLSSDLAWHEGMPDWVPLTEIEGINAITSAVPPPRVAVPPPRVAAPPPSVAAPPPSVAAPPPSVAAPPPSDGSGIGSGVFIGVIIFLVYIFYWYGGSSPVIDKLYECPRIGDIRFVKSVEFVSGESCWYTNIHGDRQQAVWKKEDGEILIIPEGLGVHERFTYNSEFDFLTDTSGRKWE